MGYPKNLACHFLGVGGVVIEQNKVLLVKLSYGKAKGKLLIPGGLVEKGETLEEGLKREILEETGLQVETQGIIGIRSMVRSLDHLTDVYTIFKCKLVSDMSTIKMEDDEITDIEWVPLDELDRNDVPNYTRTIVEKALNGHVLKPDLELNKKVMARKDLLKYSQFWS